MRKCFQKFERNNYSDSRMCARQLQKNMWIVKPDNENRGIGIEIVSSWKELVNHMLTQKRDKLIV